MYRKEVTYTDQGPRDVRPWVRVGESHVLISSRKETGGSQPERTGPRLPFVTWAVFAR